MLQPLELRHALEVEIVVLLAGEVGEDVAGPGESAYRRPSDDHARAELVARAMAELTPRERAQLADETPVDDDWTRASRTSHTLVGDLAVQHLSLMRAVTREIVFSPAAVRMITALAEALLKQETISAAECLRVLEKAAPHSHTQEEAMARSPATPAASEMFVCLDSYVDASLVGAPVFQRGSLFPGDHPTVAAHPDLWARASTCQANSRSGGPVSTTASRSLRGSPSQNWMTYRPISPRRASRARGSPATEFSFDDFVTQ